MTTAANRRFNREVDARQIAFQASLQSWLLRLARREARRVTSLYSLEVNKAFDPMESELMTLMLRFGFRTAVDSAKSAASEVGKPDAIPPSLYRDALAGKPMHIRSMERMIDQIGSRARDITAESIKAVNESVRVILDDSAREIPSPSAGEIARRIHTQLHGSEDRVFTFSPERAATIARTELGQMTNAGKMSGFEVTGIEEVEWLSVTSDRRSGERRHWEMNGVKVKRGTYFTLPSGAQLLHPGDVFGPASETINCRCTVRPVFR